MKESRFRLNGIDRYPGIFRHECSRDPAKGPRFDDRFKLYIPVQVVKDLLTKLLSVEGPAELRAKRFIKMVFECRFPRYGHPS
jgi:hypothetical protein